MAENSKIQWTDATWNVARGCHKVSEGCKFCYMMREAAWRGYDGMAVTKTKTVFNLPLKIKEPSKIFTSSLTDFFVEEIDEYRNEAWSIIRKCPQHTFQILTKRIDRVEKCLPKDWNKGYPNVWLGVSTENQVRSDERIPILLDLPAAVRWISAEPLLGPLDLTNYLYSRFIMGGARHPYNKLDWVVVGGESGFGKHAEDKNVKWQYRECKIEWINKIIQDCGEAGVPAFMKQFGTHLAKEFKMKDGHGGDIDEWAVPYKVRQFPEKVENLLFQ